MPTHVRKQIRDAVAGLLASPATSIPASRILIGQTRPLGGDYPPTILIYTSDETSGRQYDGNPASLGRTLLLHIDGRLCAVEPPDDELDALALEIEGVMLVDHTLGGLCFDSFLGRTVSAVRASGEKHEGSIRLEYRVRYNEPAEAEED